MSGADDEVEIKNHLKQLMAEQTRKENYQKRLEKKLQRLDADLGVKRAEVESLIRSLNFQKEKEAMTQKSMESEQRLKLDKQHERIRKHLSEVLYTKSKSKGKKRGPFQLDTVRVTYIRRDSTVRYNLCFRMDATTTIQNLRDDACKYWSVDPGDYILKTMANSKCQNEIRVQDCLDKARLRSCALSIGSKTTKL